MWLKTFHNLSWQKVMHMWRLVIASEHHPHDLCEEEEGHGSGRSTPVADNLPGNIDASPIVITTMKVSIPILCIYKIMQEFV